MKWKNCKNSEELEKEYTDINTFLKEWNNKFPNIKLENVSSWNTIFSAIKPFIEFLKTERYFMILNEVDNPSRADMLGLTEEIVNDPKKMKSLRNYIAKFIAPDHNNNSDESNKAMAKLNEIFKEAN